MSRLEWRSFPPSRQKNKNKPLLDENKHRSRKTSHMLNKTSEEHAAYDENVEHIHTVVLYKLRFSRPFHLLPRLHRVSRPIDRIYRLNIPKRLNILDILNRPNKTSYLVHYSDFLGAAVLIVAAITFDVTACQHPLAHAKTKINMARCLR